MGTPGSRGEAEGVAKQRRRSITEIAGGHSRDPEGEEEVFNKVLSQVGSQSVKSGHAHHQTGEQVRMGEGRGTVGNP